MLRRRAKLRTYKTLRAHKPMRRRRGRPRRSPQVVDLDYREWIRTQPCACPELPRHPGGDPHHPRHQPDGGSIGAGLKSDDHRLVPLSRQHHGDLHALAGPFRGWTGQQLRTWLDEQGAIHRARYLATHEGATWAVTS